MSVEEEVLEKLRELPPEHQREVLNFVEFLAELEHMRLADQKRT